MSTDARTAEQLVERHGNQAIDLVLAKIQGAVRRADDDAVRELDRTLRQIEALLAQRYRFPN